MEAVGAAASLTQFALLALKCVKEAHEALSSFKDGPDILRLLSNDFLRVHDILERLHQSTSTSAVSALDAHIQQSIQAICSRAVSLVGLQATPGDNGGKRLWKQIKTVVSESDVKRIRDELGQLVIILNLRLSGLSWDIVSEVKDNTRRVQQQIQTLDITLQSQDQLQKANLQAFEKSLLTTYKDNHSNVQDQLSSIEQKLESKASISTKEYAHLFSFFSELKDIVISRDTTTRDLSNDDRTVREDTANKSQNQAMLASIDRLCLLIDKKREAVNVYAEDDEFAESAIEDLRDLLTAIQREKQHEVEKEMLSDLRRFGRSFGQYEVSINSRNHENRQVTGRILDQQRTHKQADIGIGKVSIMIHKRKRTLFAGDEGDVTEPAKGSLTDYSMSLTFLPKEKRAHHMLMATISKSEILAGHVSSISHLQVNRVLPSDSLVFQLVENGKIKELCQLFQSGEASLRDHDENGSSLLFYSLKQPEMCKFLLEEGLDVDHVVLKKDYSDPRQDTKLCNCLHIHWNYDGLILDRELKKINACRRLLLTAGADPTYKDPNKRSSKSFLDNIKATPDRVIKNVSKIESYVLDIWDTVDLAWNSGLVSPFASFRDWRNWEGMSAFLNACTNHKISIDILERLISMGANIHDRSDRGESCLHLLVGHTRSETAPTIRLECLAYLLQQGADPFVQDDQERTASDIAYNMLGPADVLDGTIGDIWDAALHISGYDIAEFRATRRRRPRYYFFYTRQLFEELWKGREDECPYWNDEPWPPLGPGEEASDDDSVCTSYGCVSDFDMLDDEDPLEEEESDNDDDEDGSAMLQRHQQWAYMYRVLVLYVMLSMIFSLGWFVSISVNRGIL